MEEGLNPNLCEGHTFDKRNRESYLTTVSSGSGSGRGGGPLVRENVITIDGHIIDKRITKVALEILVCTYNRVLGKEERL